MFLYTSNLYHYTILIHTILVLVLVLFVSFVYNYPYKYLYSQNLSLTEEAQYWQNETLLLLLQYDLVALGHRLGHLVGKVGVRVVVMMEGWG